RSSDLKNERLMFLRRLYFLPILQRCLFVMSLDVRNGSVVLNILNDINDLFILWRSHMFVINPIATKSSPEAIISINIFEYTNATRQKAREHRLWRNPLRKKRKRKHHPHPSNPRDAVEQEVLEQQ